MNRLTKYSHGAARVDSSHTISHVMGEYIGEPIERLAAYEDSGLTPEEVQRLAKDPESLRHHGRWKSYGVLYGRPTWSCSNCTSVRFSDRYPYCPNCGAKMDLKEA